MTLSVTPERAVEGRFGPYGGRYVPETLVAALDDLAELYDVARQDPSFWAEFEGYLADIAGRPSILTPAPRLSHHVGVPVWLKREDLNHTGSHKINNTIGQALLALRMGKRRIIAETGAGQHGVATATVCARFGLECVVYMGAEDVARQALNVYRMQLLGATVVPVESGTRTLKDATNEALRDWVTNVPTTHYIIGSVVGPDPYPRMVRDFQAVIGREARAQMLSRTGNLPHTVVACVGGGSNAMGIFSGFLTDASVELVGIEAAGEGLNSHRHSATLTAGTPGVLHGSLSYLLQDEDGQVAPAHSVSAGLDYPGVGPEHSWLRDTGRVRYETADDLEALTAFQTVCRLEGIIPALETAHALAWLLRQRGKRPGNASVLVCFSGRGDKDVAHVAAILGGEGVTANPNDVVLPTSQVSELLQSLVKALRAFQIYLPNNPMYQRASQNVRSGFAPIWTVLDDLELQVAETDFVWEGQVVYHQLTKSESLAWMLYKDGMRVLTLRKGVDEQEIIRFLEVVNRARFMQQDAADDLLTLLWEQEFYFISYQFVEGFGDEVVPEAVGRMGGDTTTSAAQVQQQVREEAQPRSAGIVDLEEFDSTLYFLDENEVAAVAEQLRQEYTRDARASALAALYDIFETESDRAVRDEIIGVLETLLPNLLNAGEFRAVASVMRDVRLLVQKAPHLSTELRDRLLAFEAKLSEPEIVRQLMVSLDGAVALAGDEDVTEVLRELHPAALGAIVTFLPTLNNAHVRELLEQAADRIAASSPTEVLKLLRDPSSTALKEIVEMCGRLKLQGAVPGLGETVRSPDPAVRLASVLALAEVASPGALTAMEAAIDDDDRAVRLAAVRAMGAKGIRNALKRIEPVILGKSSRDLDLTEKMAFFEAYGGIAGATAIPTLQSMLLSRGLLGYKAGPDTRACAAVALGRIRTPEARAVLQKVADDKELVVRQAVSRALRGQPS